MTMLYGIYNLLLTGFLILSLPLLPFLLLSGRRFRKGFLQRLAFYPSDVGESMRGARPVWIHAVSVGEVISAGHLVRQLQQSFPGRKILLSTFTATGHEIGRQAVASADAVVFLPLDHPWVVRRALTLFDPSILIFLETEIWPNLLRTAHRRGIPALLLSGRLSPRALRRYSLFRPFFGRVVRQFTAVGVQSREDAERMARLGVDPGKVFVTGSLKFASLEEKGADGVGSDESASALDGKKVLVAGSTHRGEEEILLDSFLALKSRFPALVMVLAPRHPQRFSEVERLLRKKGVAYEKRSQMDGRVAEATDVIFLDTLGDLPAYYSLADIAFVGGSLVDAGGHNVMEPARMRKPVLFGPYMTNFAAIAGEMKRRGAGIEVRGKEDFIREVSSLLSDRERAEETGKMAYLVVQEGREVIERNMELISRYLQP